ncbi:hypothetical protein FDECE_10894 [Fusarium decemcellulare]|nr:hypothetical protein FDECE_10894 [Fusarium decemcellulare]
MSLVGETAYITGILNASEFPFECGRLKDTDGMKIFIADWNPTAAEQVAAELNSKAGDQVAWAAHVDVSDWKSQRQAFESAVKQLGRIDYVFPIMQIPEQHWLPEDLGTRSGKFEKPNLKVFEVNANGAFYSAALAISQFRRQEPNMKGFRGKICSIASACGFYCIPTLPVYTASEHAVVGFTRAFGRYLPREQITLNTICPNIVAAGISTGSFYEKAEARDHLITLEALTSAFEHVMTTGISGEAIEVLSGDEGFLIRKDPEFTNEKCKQSIELARAPDHRAWKLHEPILD